MADCGYTAVRPTRPMQVYARRPPAWSLHQLRRATKLHPAAESQQQQQQRRRRRRRRATNMCSDSLRPVVFQRAYVLFGGAESPRVVPLIARPLDEHHDAIHARC